jgi:uncharacterized protein YdcH (DUF465 family)
MESHEKELIRKLSKENFELKKLYEQHQSLEKKLSRFEKRTFLNSIEQVEAKQLKVAKLKGVDRMMKIISVHKAA